MIKKPAAATAASPPLLKRVIRDRVGHWRDVVSIPVAGENIKNNLNKESTNKNVH